MKNFLRIGMLTGMLIVSMALVGCSGNGDTNEDTNETDAVGAADADVAGTDEATEPVIVVEEPAETADVTETPAEETDAADVAGTDTSAVCNKVLMGGASFTGMEPLQTDNYEDGTYYYADKHTDETLTIINCATAIPQDAFASPEDMIAACIEQWSPNGTNQDIEVTTNDDYSDQFAYPAYTVTWTESGDGELSNCNAVVVEADGYVYAYIFKESSSVSAEESMSELYPEYYAGLTLNEVQ